MSRFQSKSTYHTKTHEELKLNEERQSKDDNTKRTGLLELYDKDFKAAMCFNEQLQMHPKQMKR